MRPRYFCVGILLLLLFATPSWAGKSNLGILARRTKTTHRNTQLKFYSVKPYAMSSRILRELMHHRDAKLTGCSLPSTTMSSLGGTLTVRGRLTAAGTLKIDRIFGTRQHTGLESCFRAIISKWRLSYRSSDAGKEVSFKLYVRFPGSSWKRSRSSKSLGSLMGTGVGGGGLIGRGGGGGYGAGYGGYSSSYYRSKATFKVDRVKGGLTASVVSWAFRQWSYTYGIRYCHRGGAKRSTSLSGTLKLKLEVSPLGSIRKIEQVATGKLDDAKFQNCILARTLRDTLPAAKSATTISLTLSFPAAKR